MLKDIVKRIISALYPDCHLLRKVNGKYKILCNFIYSSRYCRRFNCKNVYFRRKLNFVLGEQYFKIGEGSGFGKQAVLTAWDTYEDEHFTPVVSIGEHCGFGDYLHLTCINKIEIGNNVLTGRWVTITDNGHGTTEEIINNKAPIKRKLYTKGPTIIEDNVWIGDKATILPGVTIGKGSIVGANSVVTKSIPPYSVVAGNPAKIIKTIQK